MLWLATLGAPCAFAEPSKEPIRLTGVVDLPELQLAIIESKPAHQGAASGLWSVGQRIGGFEVEAIKAENGAVTGMLHGSNVVFQINPTPNRSAPPPHLHLEHASLDPVLMLYGKLSNRSVLRSPLLPAVTVAATSGVTNRSELLALLERQLADQGIVLVPDGEKFVAALRKAEAARFKPASPPRQSDVSTPAADDLPAGSINFQAAPLSVCVTLYADFAGKQLDRASLALLPDSKVVFVQQNTLTKAECLYAFETLLRINGVELQPADGGLVRAVLISGAKR